MGSMIISRSGEDASTVDVETLLEYVRVAVGVSDEVWLLVAAIRVIVCCFFFDKNFCAHTKDTRIAIG